MRGEDTIIKMVVVFTVLLVLIWVSPAFAYIDPFLGGLFYQLVAAIFAVAVSAPYFLGE